MAGLLARLALGCSCSLFPIQILVAQAYSVRRSVSLNSLTNQQYGKLQKCFDIIITILRLVGSSNLGFYCFQIFEYI